MRLSFCSLSAWPRVGRQSCEQMIWGEMVSPQIKVLPRCMEGCWGKLEDCRGDVLMDIEGWLVRAYCTSDPCAVTRCGEAVALMGT